MSTAALIASAMSPPRPVSRSGSSGVSTFSVTSVTVAANGVTVTIVFNVAPALVTSPDGYNFQFTTPNANLPQTGGSGATLTYTSSVVIKATDTPKLNFQLGGIITATGLALPYFNGRAVTNNSVQT